MNNSIDALLVKLRSSPSELVLQSENYFQLDDQAINQLVGNNKDLYSKILDIFKNIKAVNQNKISGLLNIILLELYLKNNKSVNTEEVGSYLNKIYVTLNELIVRYNGNSFGIYRDPAKLNDRINVFFNLLISLITNNENARISKLVTLDDIKTDNIISGEAKRNLFGGRKTRRRKTRKTRKNKTRYNRKRTSHRRK
jgi:hypothetical protein